MNKDKLIIWPDNGYYIAFSLMTSLAVFNLYFMAGLPIHMCPLPIFISFILIAYFFSQRLVIDYEKGEVIGPSAYGKRRNRTTIPINECEAFFEYRKSGKGYLVIRHTTSSRQIFVPFVFFSKRTIHRLTTIFPNKSSNENAYIPKKGKEQLT